MFAGIAKNVVLFAVSMKVKTRLDLGSLCVILNLFLDLKDLWMKYLGRLFPSSVQINSSDITSKIAIYDSIYIDHWIYFDNTVVKNMLDLWSLLKKTIHDS